MIKVGDSFIVDQGVFAGLTATVQEVPPGKTSIVFCSVDGIDGSYSVTRRDGSVVSGVGTYPISVKNVREVSA